MEMKYETIIGLEVHVELSTKTKIFCGCSTEFGGEPNTHTCPVCMGMPGSLPVLNKQAVEYAIAVGLATNCEISRRFGFDRKNYFYPDNPQNYQISQLYQPVCRNGYIEITLPEEKKKIGIHEIHMEEDAGKLLHDAGGEYSLVDFNRAGVPLIEIVSQPDMRNAKEVIEYLEQLKSIIQYLGVSDCKMQEGSLRVDVNLSVRKTGSKELGVRTEMKNLNSFRSITRAVDKEAARQIALLEAGEAIVMETRRWEDTGDNSYPMRSKEETKDYRYFPEPDLGTVVVSEEWLEAIKSRQPELPDQKQKRYRQEYALPKYDIAILTGNKHLAELFERTAAICRQPKKVSNWIMSETMRLLNDTGTEPENIAFSPANLAKLIMLTDSKSISGTVAKEVFAVMFEKDIDPEHYVAENNLKTVQDEVALKAAIRQVMADNPQSVADYRAGKEKAVGFLVGQTMKAMKGKANPEAVGKILREVL